MTYTRKRAAQYHWVWVILLISLLSFAACLHVRPTRVHRTRRRAREIEVTAPHGVLDGIRCRFLIGAGELSYFGCSAHWSVQSDPVHSAWHTEHVATSGTMLAR